ncbi:MAG: 7TM diverse intracellular signaling domain-containing protein, partial [bacterium]
MRFLSVVRHLRFLLIAFLVLIAVILLVFFLPTAPEPSANQTAKKGVFDLRGWDFRQDGNVKLTGEWEFYWNQFLPPEGYRQRLAKGSQNSDFVTLPRTWNGQFVNGKELSGFGYASYRLTVRLSETDRVLSVLVKPMATAYDLWINGERIAFNGKIGTSAKSMEPRYLSRVAAFKPSGPDIEILLRVSNFMHRRGGVWRAIIMGDHDTITQLRDNSIAKDWMLSAGLIILGMYHLAVFFQRRKDTEAFYLAGFCLFMALRVWLVGERLLYAALANFSWELSHKLEYLSVMISVMFLFTFVQKLYPDEYRAKIQYLVNGVILLFILTVLVTRSRIYSWIIIPFEVFGLIIGIYIIYVIYRAIRNKRTNARLMMAAVVVVALFGLNDVLHANQIIYTTELFHLGVMLAALLQTLVLSRIFVNALENSEQLSTELARRNAILDESNRLKENRSRELELQLFRSQKLEAIGTLTGGIAHDFNNILGTMMGYIEMLIDT